MTESRRGLAKAASLIAMGNIASRVLGLVREIVIAGLFGATGAVSAFRTAEFVPRQFYDLLVGGMVSSALVPIFSEYAEKDRNAFWRIASLLLSLVTVAVGIMVLLAELFAPQIAWLLGGSELDLELLTSLLRLTIPAMLFLSLSGVITGLLYALKRFVFPAFTAAAFNAAVIIVTVVGAVFLNWGIEIVAVGVVAGALAQVLLQAPGLRGGNIRFRVDMKHPALRKIGRLYQPIILGLVVTLFQTSLDRRLANSTGASSLAWMQNATTLIQFPVGLVSVAISQAILPTLSRFGAQVIGTEFTDQSVHSEAEMGFVQTLFGGVRMVLILIVPATVGLFVLAEPIISLLFQHGQFTAFDSAQTTLALRIYLLGLIFAAVDLPLIFAYYARQNTFTPAMVGVASVGVYLLFALVPYFLGNLQMGNLILADSVKHMSHVLLMLWLISRWTSLRGHQLAQTVLKTAFSAGAMGLILWLGSSWLIPLLPPVSLLNEILTVGILSAVGGAVYVVLIWLFQVEEARLITEAVRRRM